MGDRCWLPRLHKLRWPISISNHRSEKGAQTPQVMLVEEHAPVVCRLVGWLCSTGVVGYESRHAGHCCVKYASQILKCTTDLGTLSSEVTESRSRSDLLMAVACRRGPGVEGQGYSMDTVGGDDKDGGVWAGHVRPKHSSLLPASNPTAGWHHQTHKQLWGWSFVGLVKECQNWSSK